MKLLKKKRWLSFLILVLILTGYFGYQKLTGEKDTVQYVTASAKKSTLIVSVSGSGQVAVSDQVDIKPKVSGEIASIGVETGQEVKSGALIAQFDTKDVQEEISDAEVALANAETKIKDLENTKRKAEESLVTAYKDALHSLTNAFEDLSSGMSNLQEMFTESSYRGSENDIDYYVYLVKDYDNSEQLSYWNETAEEKYSDVKNRFDKLKSDYFILTLNSPSNRIEDTLNKTYDFAQEFLDLVRQSYNLGQKYQMIIETESLIPPIPIGTTDTQVSQLGEFTSLFISRVNSLLSTKQSLEDKKEAVEKANSDIEDQDYVIEQDKETLLDAKEKLGQHYVYAPFDGTISKVSVKKGDSVTSGTTLATLITKQKIAEITLNEIDAANVKLGQKATITFDAIDDLSVTGELINIDSIGTVSQGVVTYGAQISLDLQDERVKPGMSVSVEIITQAKQDALLIPNAAIKSQNNIKYVQVMGTDNVVYSQEVKTGISNDTYTEITNGLAEGDKVVTQTVSTGNSSKSSSSSFGPNNGGSMEMMRMIQ